MDFNSTNPQQLPTTSSTNSQQQYLSNCCSTNMPAMPKEKATAVSLTENNFSELKLKELTTNTINTTSSTASANITITNNMATATATQQQQQQHHHRAQQISSATNSQHQQQTHHRGSLCGCGNASALVENQMRTQYMPNGHSSPLAAALAAAQTNLNTSNNTSSSASSNLTSSTTALSQSPQRSTCCRTSFHQQQQQQLQTSALTNGIAHNTTTTTTTTTTASSAIPIAAAANASTQQQTTASATSSSSSNLLNPNNSSISTSSSSPQPSAVTPPRRSPNDYIFGKFIGDGSFSTVYLAVDYNTRREFAIKVCEKRQILREHKQEYIRREREVMHLMTNVPGFVNLSCTFQDNRSLYFVMTYAKNGDLLPYINKVGSFDIDSTRHYAAELVLACEQMHSRNVVHRDLKPENILLDEDMHTLIADFGSVKIMTDEERQQANSFLLAGGMDIRSRSQSSGSEGAAASTEDDDDDDDDDDHNDAYDEDGNDSSASSTGGCGVGEDEVDSIAATIQRANRRQRRRYQQQQSRHNRRRRGSFVGTAQYVSPEVLQNAPITPAADLWALGCIIYQMMSGLPPFRGGHDYVIFKDILACNLDFPHGFDKDAEDLVRKLLKLNPAERLGAQDCAAGRFKYDSIRSHPFFKNVDFDSVRQQTPPAISPFLPDLNKQEQEHFTLAGNLEPGLDDKQLTRLLGIELGINSDDDTTTNNHHSLTTTTRFVRSGSTGTASTAKSTAVSTTTTPMRGGGGGGGTPLIMQKKTSSAKNSFDISDAEKHKRLDLQAKTDKWHAFAEGEVILKKGFVNKRKGLFARRRMFLLTTGPRLIYIDPVQMIKKGEIPWSPELRAEAKNFKIFFVHTPNRTYYLDDPEGFGLQWVDVINQMHALTYKDQLNNAATTNNNYTFATPNAVATKAINATSVRKSYARKTSSNMSSSTPNKTSSLLTTPLNTLLKTASN